MFKIYQEEFERDVRTYEALATKAELVQAASQANLVYVADYHSLPQAQKTVVKLLLALAPIRPEMVLCVEVVYASDQAWLDRYMAESIDDDEFLRRIDYHHRWGFEWGPYREILQVARKLPPRERAQALRQIEAARRRTRIGREHARAGRAFLALNARRKGWKTLASGLQIRVLRVGKGTPPGPRDLVRVRFVGRSTKGLLIHRSPEAGERYHLRAVIPGWAEALRGMRPGGAVELALPAELAYGLRGNARLKVGPRQVLRYRLELVDVLPAGGKR